VNNMCPVIVVPDSPAGPTNGNAWRPTTIGGWWRRRLNDRKQSSDAIDQISDGSTLVQRDRSTGLAIQFEGNETIYMRPSYPPGVQSYISHEFGLQCSRKYQPSIRGLSYVQAWIAPEITRQASSTNVLERQRRLV
jgi:hypothetical protein